MLRQMSIQHLREECKNRGLPKSGKKQQLVIRLAEHRVDENAYPLKQLQCFAKRRGIPYSGSKATIASRLNGTDVKGSSLS